MKELGKAYLMTLCYFYWELKYMEILQGGQFQVKCDPLPSWTPNPHSDASYFRTESYPLDFPIHAIRASLMLKLSLLMQNDNKVQGDSLPEEVTLALGRWRLSPFVFDEGSIWCLRHPHQKVSPVYSCLPPSSNPFCKKFSETRHAAQIAPLELIPHKNSLFPFPSIDF